MNWTFVEYFGSVLVASGWWAVGVSPILGYSLGLVGCVLWSVIGWRMGRPSIWAIMGVIAFGQTLNLWRLLT